MAPFTHPDRQHASSSNHNHSTPFGGESRGRGGGAGRGGGRGGRGGARGGGAAVGGQPGGIPTGSVSKLKAQIRQTTRLLAKDDLNADVRLTSERRLQSLEAELAKASTSNLEKKMQTKYRGVKFFERQKVLRRIKQAKKDSASQPQPLLEARIDLYYILTYPKTAKYIALFPEGAYVPHSPPISPPTAASKSREQLRAGIRARMDRGELGAEPEEGDLEIEGEESVQVSGAGEKRASAEEEEAEGAVEEDRPAKKSKATAVEPAQSVLQPKTAPATAAPAPVPAVPVAKGEAPVERKKGKKDRKARRESEAAALAAQKAEVEGEGGQSGAFAGDDFFA